jgi:hypothetical protein
LIIKSSKFDSLLDELFITYYKRRKVGAYPIEDEPIFTSRHMIFGGSKIAANAENNEETKVGQNGQLPSF